MVERCMSVDIVNMVIKDGIFIKRKGVNTVVKDGISSKRNYGDIVLQVFMHINTTLPQNFL